MSTQRKVSILTFLMLSAFLLPIQTVQADGGGSIEVFGNGSGTLEMNFDGVTSSNITIDLLRNTTITNATFAIATLPSSQSPGQVWLDIDEDGQHEWNFTNPSYGDFGDQNVFEGGSSSDTVQTSSGTLANSTDILVPQGLSISSVNLDTSYQAAIGGGFFAIGNVLDIQSNDVDGDALNDAVVLSQNGTSSEIHVYSMTTGGVVSILSSTTCATNRLLVDDFDGDGYADVASVNLSSFRMCIHMYNSTTSQFNQQVNNTLSNSIIDVGVGDMTGDGAADLMTIRTNGEVALQEFDDRNIVYSQVAQGHSVTISENNSAIQATLIELYVERFDGPNSDFTAVVTDNSMSLHSTEIIYQSSTSSLASTSVVFDTLPAGASMSDIDDDGDIDFVMSGQQGIVFANNTGSGWVTNTITSTMNLDNAVVFDHNGDGQKSIFVPDTGVTDNNPQTIEGKLVGHHVNIGSINTTSFDLEPWTNPDKIHTLDFDGDGITDQVIGAGESNQLGVFIGSWHQAMYDIDKNGDIDVSAEGYAGNGMYGTSTLDVPDVTNEILNLLPIASAGWPSTTDGYGVKMSSFNMSYTSSGNGSFVLSSLSIRYTATFIVDYNPHIKGNLTNIFNQKMEPGTGSLTIQLPFNSSKQGSIQVRDLNVLYVDGAPNLVIPPTPVLKVDTLTSTMVQISWQNQSSFGNDLLNFAVYRTLQGESVDITQQPYDAPNSNLSIDMNVQANSTYTYYVRSIHDNGIVSNLSDPLNVTVPFPPAPGQILNVSASDKSSDEGSAIMVTWDAGNTSIEQYHIFVNTSTFTDVSGMNISKTVTSQSTSTEITVDSFGNSLVNGVGYFVAVVGADEHGNYTTSVMADGPVYPRNDTILEPTLSLIVANTSHHEALHTVILDETFEIHAFLESQHGPEQSKSVTVELASGTVTHSAQLITDEQGIAVATLDDFTTLLDVAEIFGELTITASFSGDDHPMSQPLNSAETNRTVLGGAIVEVEIPEVAELTDGQYSIQVELTTTPTVIDSVYSTTTLEWQRKSSDGSLHDEGTVQTSSFMTLSGAGVDGQLLEITFSQIPEYLFFSQTTAEVSLLSESTTIENNTTTDWTPTQISDVTISCSIIELSFVVESSPMSYECTLVNPNPFSVNVSFDIESVDVVGVSFTIDNVVMEDNETKVVSITANRDSNVVLTSGGTYDSTVSIYTSWTESQDLMTSTASLISWSIGNPVEITDDPTEQPESTSSLQSLLLPVGGGLLSLVVVIFVVSKIVTSRSPKEDDDDEDDWYEEAMDMVEPKDNEQPKEEVPIKTKSLDDLKSEGKTIGEDAPEERGIDFSLGGATKNEIEVHSDDEEPIPETQDAEMEEVSDSDDGISVDEDGTEWYEDELGVWWYREQGWDDWAEWQE